MLNGNYSNTKLLLMKLRRDNETNYQRTVSASPIETPRESRINHRDYEDHQHRLGRPYISGTSTKKFEEVRPHKVTMHEQRTRLGMVQAETRQQRDNSRTSAISQKSDNYLPEDKPVGRSEKRIYANKADLRYDISDINNKKRKFIYSFEREHPRDKERLANYLKAQNLDKYSKALPERPVDGVVDYRKGIYKPEESRFMEGNPNNNSYLIHQNNSTVRRIDQMKRLLKNEACNIIDNNAIILRNEVRLPNPKGNTAWKPASKSPNIGLR